MQKAHSGELFGEALARPKLADARANDFEQSSRVNALQVAEIVTTARVLPGLLKLAWRSFSPVYRYTHTMHV